MRNLRTLRTFGLTKAALVLGAALLAGCNDEEAQKAFRGAADSALQSGALSIASGLINGSFAVFGLGSDPNAAAAASSSSSSSTTTPSGG